MKEDLRQMRLMFKGLTVDDRTQEYIVKRLKPIEKLIEDTSRVEIEINKDKKGKFRVELMVKTPRKTYRAEDTTESIGGSADSVTDEVRSQIERDKDKIWTKMRRGAISIKKKMTIFGDARF